MTVRCPGMDHDLYRYAPLSKRSTWIWGNKKRIAVCIFLYFEYWELDPPPGALHDRSFHRYLGALHPNCASILAKACNRLPPPGGDQARDGWLEEHGRPRASGRGLAMLGRKFDGARNREVAIVHLGAAGAL